MTQQPFYPPQYPGYPQQAFPPPGPQQGYPVQQQPAPQYGGYPPQAPQQPPAVPLANGTLDDFYNQPSGGGGPAVSWKDKPLGTAIQAVVARDVTSADIQQETDPVTGQPKFFRDGRPKFVMKVPLKVATSQEHPEGEAVLFVRGQLRDELVRAMAAANAGNAPKGGDQLIVQLTQRKPSRQGNPQNVFTVQYASAQGGQSAPAPAPAPAAPAVDQGQQMQLQQPQQASPYLQQAASELGLPQVAQQAPAQQPVFQPPAQQVAPQAPAPTPASAAQGGMQMPPNLSPEQQQLFARLAGQQG